MNVGYIPVHMGLSMSMSAVDDTKNLSTNPVFLLETNPSNSNNLLTTLSIFDV